MKTISKVKTTARMKTTFKLWQILKLMCHEKKGQCPFTYLSIKSGTKINSWPLNATVNPSFKDSSRSCRRWTNSEILGKFSSPMRAAKGLKTCILIFYVHNIQTYYSRNILRAGKGFPPLKLLSPYTRFYREKEKVKKGDCLRGLYSIWDRAVVPFEPTVTTTVSTNLKWDVLLRSSRAQLHQSLIYSVILIDTVNNVDGHDTLNCVTEAEELGWIE